MRYLVPLLFVVAACGSDTTPPSPPPRELAMRITCMVQDSVIAQDFVNVVIVDGNRAIYYQPERGLEDTVRLSPKIRCAVGQSTK